jgi:2-polyprenyl-3-methyl-5-hydroxy-6-metoxy-1,4-benzoquinol methylase
MVYNYQVKREILNSPYDRIARKYDHLFGDRNPYYHAVNRCEKQLFEDWAPLNGNCGRALDVGCGTGFHTKWLVDRGFDSLGIDKSRDMIEVANANSAGWDGRKEFKVIDVEDMARLPRNTYGVVFCLGSVLNHLEDWKGFAQLISERLTDGGSFFFSYDNMDGIDVIARALLRQFAGYSDSYVRDILFGRVKALLTGNSFHNHWRVSMGEATVEIPLKYERTRKWRLFLEEAGLSVCDLRGTHVLDCFDRSLLRASAGTNLIKERQTTWRQRCLGATDRVVARKLYHIAANIVGMAVKTRKERRQAETVPF